MINKIKIHLTFFIIVISSTVNASITLENAYKASLEKTEPMIIAESQLRGAEAKVTQSRSNYFPNLSLKEDYLNQSTEIGASAKKEQSDFRISLTQSLLAGGKDSANTDLAESLQTAAEYNLSVTRNNLYSDVAKAFYTLMSASQEVANIDKSIELLQKRSAELQKLNAIGRTRQIDVLAVKAQSSVLKAQKLSAEADRQIAKNNFANITGLDRDSKLSDETPFPKNLNSINSYLVDLEKRPDIQGLKSIAESFEDSRRTASAGHYPTLDLTGNYYLNHEGAPNTAQSKDEWNAGLTLTIPLFAGSSVSSQIKQADELKLQSEFNLKKKLRDDETDIRTAYNTLLGAIEQIKALENALAATEQNYKEQEKGYRYKMVTNLDVLQALNTFQDTQRTLDRTHFLALNAVAQLKAKTYQIIQIK